MKVASNRRGIVLPVALLLVLALGALAGSVLAFARTELLLERSNVAYLERRVSAEADLRALGAAWGADPSGGAPSGGSRLAHGFVLLRSPPGAAPAPMAVGWILDPDSVSLPALEVGRSPPVTGVTWGGEECAAVGGRPAPLVRVAAVSGGGPGGGGGASAPDPPLPAAPRIGLLGAAEIAQGSSRALPARGTLADEGTRAVLRAPPGARYDGGRATGVLVAEGDLALEGDAAFEGVVLVSGDLRLGGTARVDGAAIVAGSARIDGLARIVGCSAAVAVALRRAGLAGFRPVPAGALLGRF